MGLYDRDYTQESYQSQFGQVPHMRMHWPKITPVVKWLLIVNISLFFVGELVFPRNIAVPGFGYPVWFTAATVRWSLAYDGSIAALD